MRHVETMNEALALHISGAMAEAEAGYRRILEADPQQVEAMHYLGVLRHQLGATEEGLALIMAALELNDHGAERYNDLGNILVQIGDMENAAVAFDCSLRLNDTDAIVWNNLGSVLHRQKNLADAESAYRNALRCDAQLAPALNNLAALLNEIGQTEEASLLWCQAYVLPPLEGKPAKMLGIAYYRLGRIADAAESYRAWSEAEPDNEIARHHLAACSGENVPDRSSDDYLRAVFDAKAEVFDAKLVGTLSYRGPEIIGQLLESRLVGESSLDVLDGGCGTGLCGPVLAPYARRLTGVDLSSGMLAKARSSNRYDELVESELTSYLCGRRNAFDLVAMADTLIYFGALDALFAATAQALRTSGLFAFTVEVAEMPVDDPLGYRLNPSGRYSHSLQYVRDQLGKAGLEVLRCDEAILRTEFFTPTKGLGVLAARCA